MQIISPDKSGRIDPPVYAILRDLDSPLPIVPITVLDNFEFDPSALDGIGAYVLVDFCEYGWDWNRKETHLFGKNTDRFAARFPGDEWRRFNSWVADNPPSIYFKRELLAKDVIDDRLVPIEYPCLYPAVRVETQSEFENRPFEVFHYWGRSHECRLVFHGNVWKHASVKGINVCDNLHQVAKFATIEHGRKWVTVNVPHYARTDMNHVLSVNGCSILSVSLPGAGIKCFRHSEAPVNSIMVLQDDPMAWSFRWTHGHNCIRVPIADGMEGILGRDKSPEIAAIEEALSRDDLYSIYVMGMNTVDKYRLCRYQKEYLEPLIKSVA